MIGRYLKKIVQNSKKSEISITKGYMIAKDDQNKRTKRQQKLYVTKDSKFAFE